MMSGGAAVSWGSKLEEVVALSSTEAEYMALTHAAEGAMYLSYLQAELGIDRDGGGVLLLSDNQSSMKIARYVANGDSSICYSECRSRLTDLVHIR